MYRRTGDPSYYDTAVRVANYFLDNIPVDGIVPWYVTFSYKWPSFQWVCFTRDFNAPLIPAPRPADSSAATIAANGLLLLSQVEPSLSLKQKWSNAAIGVCFFLLSKLLPDILPQQLLNNVTQLAWDPSWQSLLSNGTVNEPANNQLTGTAYGLCSLSLVSMAFEDLPTLRRLLLRPGWEWINLHGADLLRYQEQWNPG